MKDQLSGTRASQGGTLLESPEYERVELVGEPGRQVEVAIYQGERAQHVILTSLSPQAVNGVGLSPEEAITLSDALRAAVLKVRR